MKHLTLLLLVLLVVSACSPTVPAQYIQPDDMEDILYDYFLSQSMSRERRVGDHADAARTEYYLAVLKKHQVTEADFDSSMVYYYGHAEYLKSIFTRVNERLADEAKSLGASVGAIGQYSQYSATGDTANIWKEATDIMLMPRPTMNRFDFHVAADSTFRKGDSFMFQFAAEYLWQSGLRDAVVCVKSEYEGDSIVQTYSHLSSMGTCQLRIPANRERSLRKMSGFIYLNDEGDARDIRRIMFISHIQLIRFHDTKLADEPSSQKQNTADSLQRTTDSIRPMPDSASHRTIGRRHGGTPLLAPGRAAIHRVDAGPAKLKK